MKHHEYCRAWGGQVCTCGLDLRAAELAALEAVARAAEEVKPEHEPVADCCPMCRLKIASAKLAEVRRG